MKTVRNESTGNAAITVAETIIVTAERMPTVKTVAGAEKNANTAESGISGGIETTTERIIRVETTNVENKNGVTIHSHERLDELHRNGYWIWVPEPGSYQSCWRQRPKGNILPGWKFSRRVQIWRREASPTIIWKRKLRL